MQRRPRRPGKRLLGKLILWRCAFVSGLLVILVLGMYGECILPYALSVHISWVAAQILSLAGLQIASCAGDPGAGDVR